MCVCGPSSPSSVKRNPKPNQGSKVLAQVVLGGNGGHHAAHRQHDAVRFKEKTRGRRGTTAATCAASDPLPTNSFCHKKSLFEQCAKEKRRKMSAEVQPAKLASHECVVPQREKDSHTAVLSRPKHCTARTLLWLLTCTSGGSSFNRVTIRNHNVGVVRTTVSWEFENVSSHAVKNISVGVSALAWCEWGLMGGAAELH